MGRFSKKFQAKNYLLFWAWIPIVLVLALIYNKPTNIALHNVYWVTTRFQISALLSLFLFLSGWAYFHFRKKGMHRQLTKWHMSLTFGGLFLLIALTTFGLPYQVAFIWIFGYFLGLLAIFMGVVLYILNILVGFRKALEK